MKDIVFIKWGGSLITDKSKPFTPNLEVIDSLSQQLKIIIDENPELKIILGHGSGSFGHSVAKKFNTRSGVKTKEEWLGFSKVWFAARELNSFVMQSLQKQNLPSITFPPSTFLNTSNGIEKSIFLETITSALNANLVPVIHGDVIFDDTLGGTILSTEDIFIMLTKYFQPQKILLAGIEPYIWEDYPNNTKPIKIIKANTFDKLQTNLQGSSNIDVTGGMSEKVRIMTEIIKKYPKTKISIFSGLIPDCLIQEIEDKPIGTLIISE
jgi:isopentenyl phosphate kinase